MKHCWEEKKLKKQNKKNCRVLPGSREQKAGEREHSYTSWLFHRQLSAGFLGKGKSPVEREEGRQRDRGWDIAFLCSPAWLSEMGISRQGPLGFQAFCSAEVLTGWQALVKGKLREKQKAGGVTQ